MAYKNFKKIWRKYGNGFKKTEPKELIIARAKFLEASSVLFSKLRIVEIDLLAGDKEALETIIGIIEIEIRTFRIGYVKQRYFRKLKSAKLSEIQNQRIREVGIDYCSTEDYRREYRELIRLLIKIADKEFISKIVKIRDISDGVVKFKANLMLDIVSHHRKDLRNE